ncbi:MAG TPA: hypothetical protein VGB79_14645 [Allosphingosinicella sp.]|jgi:hypothetical protein
MRHKKTLLAAGVAAIVGVAALPYARQALEERRIARDGAQRALWIELKEKELACLERLQASGLPKGMDVGKELDRCRALAIDPATGEAVKAPGDPGAP